jgi:hypothetical protein
VIVHIHAASLKPIDKQLASGSHYASPRDLYVIANGPVFCFFLTATMSTV